jgi:hypothetical protein
VGKGTFYNYFRTNEDIVVAFMIDIERKAQREVSKLALGKWTLESSLTRFIQLQLNTNSKNLATPLCECSSPSCPARRPVNQPGAHLVSASATTAPRNS